MFNILIKSIFECFFLYWYFIFIFLFLLFIFIYKYIKNKNKIFYLFLKPIHIDSLINNISDSFNYSYLHNKNISIVIDRQENCSKSRRIFIYATFSYSLVKLFLSTDYTYFIFFITKEGILYDIYYDFLYIDYNLASNSNLLLIYNKDYCQYNIFIKGVVFKNNSIQKTILLIKEFLMSA